MRPVKAGACPVVLETERVLGDRDLCVRGIKRFGSRIDERAVRVVKAKAESATQTFFQTRLQRVVFRFGEVATEDE